MLSQNGPASQKPPRRVRNRRPSVLQTGFRFSQRGGPREGAGRPASKDAGVPHLRRPKLDPRHPVHVTLRMQREVWNLRSRRSVRVIRRAFQQGAVRFGMRVCEFSIQGNHLHLLVEAEGERALTRGLQGLCIRIAKGLNRMMGRRGKVFADRYHAHILTSPREAFRTRQYILNNFRNHCAEWGEQLPGTFVDPFSSASRDHGIRTAPAQTWLLTSGLARGRPGYTPEPRREPRLEALPLFAEPGSDGAS